MLNATVILPAPSLAFAIQNYTLCQSDSSYMHMHFPLFAHHETTIGFFLGNTSLYLSNPTTKNVASITNKYFLFGLSTRRMQTISSKGDYDTFTIQFKPDGFTNMFGIPANEYSNNVIPVNDVIGNKFEVLYDQLSHARNQQQRIEMANKFFIGQLERKKAIYINEGVSKIACLLSGNSADTYIRYFALQANMSLRNFERKFKEQVGTSPKSFCRLLRFNSALNFKLNKPQTSWTSIAAEFNYFDIMHLIKDFKQFTNSSPAMLLSEHPDFIDNNCYKIHILQNE
jgi:AraC-like DNA-binding protein